MNKRWNIIYWESKRGASPVYEFIEKLEEKDQAKIYNSLELLEEYGLQISTSHSKKLKGFDVWELRILGSSNLRLFYASIPNRSFLLLHGIKKKSQKTPVKEIKTAQRRFEEYIIENTS